MSEEKTPGAKDMGPQVTFVLFHVEGKKGLRRHILQVNNPLQDWHCRQCFNCYSHKDP